jgi:hypothetical protein
MVPRRDGNGEYTYGEGSKEMSRFLVGDEGELDRMGKEHV